jgi:hypothetical protein
MVKNIAIRSMSMWRKGMPYTTPGVGDRIHAVLFGQKYADAHMCDVVLHLTSDKYGKQAKKDTWAELSEMTHGRVTVKAWPVCGLSEPDWIAYLKTQGVEDAQTYYYKDWIDLQPLGPIKGMDLIDADEYMTESPGLEPIDCSGQFVLPQRYVTVQWDSADKSRQLSPIMLNKVENEYRMKGLDLVVVGGEARSKYLRTSLKHVGFCMAHSEGHVGIDSGMLHMASLYIPWNRIDIYNAFGNIQGKSSHHVYRFKKYGAKLNHHI